VRSDVLDVGCGFAELSGAGRRRLRLGQLDLTPMAIAAGNQCGAGLKGPGEVSEICRPSDRNAKETNEIRRVNQ
jgi:hypothetical protein